MTARVINGREIAKRIRERVRERVMELKEKHGIEPVMGTVIVGKNEESELYLRLRDKACAECGIGIRHLRFDENAGENEVIEGIEKLNNDDSVHGIMLQQPVPSHMHVQKLIEKIDMRKDVEGLTSHNMGKLMFGDERIVPCTAKAVVKILDHADVKLEGADIVIVNHSPIVGKPLAIMMLNRNATVSVCHVFTKNLKNYTKRADVLITATGVPGLIKEDSIKEGCIVIDVGISKSDGGVRGDVKFDEVKEKASIITPVPGGVGPVTIACALENLVELCFMRVEG